MKKCTKKLVSTLVGLGGLLAVGTAHAGWIDWTSTTNGTMDIGGTTVGVTLTGSPYNYENGDYYYNNAATGYTSPTGTYAGLAPSDLIRVNHGSSFTLSFDQTVSDLHMALISVGQGGLPVTYDFNNDFTVESFGSNYWGYTGYSVSGDNFTGKEFNGILHFEGHFDSISFSTDPAEFWHAFNFSSDSLARVIEPSSVLLMGLGLLGLALTRRTLA
jgi:hypothetical protein